MSAQHGMAVEQVLLTDSIVALLCDRGGEKLSQLQAQSGCRIQLAQDKHGPEHRVCTLTGSPSAIAIARSVLQGAPATQAPPPQPAYGGNQLAASIQQYSQQAAYYRQLGMAREAEQLERQVAAWSQMAQQQQQQQMMMMAQQQQMAQNYMAMTGAAMPGGPPPPRNPEQED